MLFRRCGERKEHRLDPWELGLKETWDPEAWKPGWGDVRLETLCIVCRPVSILGTEVYLRQIRTSAA